MCGRYTLKTDRRMIEERFGLEDLPAFAPRYNLAPTQDGLVLRPGDDPGTRTAAWLRWGLVPAWTKVRGSGPLLINARSETAAAKPAFRDSFRRRRCLVIADGFYEWTRAGARRVPHHFTVHGGAPFAMAGLWDRWRPPDARDGPALDTFTILTTAANDVVAPHHDRMPVILEPAFYDDWLNPLLFDSDALRRLLRPYPALHMFGRAVGPRVNNIRFDDPDCLRPPETEAEQERHGASDAGQLDLGIG